MKINYIVINDPDVSLTHIQNCINRLPELNLIDIVKSPVEALKIVETNRINVVIAGVPERRPFFFADINGRCRKINYSEIVPS